jgi:hypothetical protein
MTLNLTFKIKVFATIAFALTMSSARANEVAEKASNVAAKPELEIVLRTNKQVYRPKEEVLFSETFKNLGSNDIQIIDDRCYYGSDIKVLRSSDRHRCQNLPCSAGHTLKPGSRPGLRQYLKPQQSFTRKFSAYITPDWHIVFQNHGGTAFTGYSAEAANTTKLPEKYFGCGQVFELQEPGKYELSISYSCKGDWSTGELHPAMPLWQGDAHAAPIDIQVKE